VTVAEVLRGASASCWCGGDADVCSERDEHQCRVQALQPAPARFYAEHCVGTCRDCKRPHLTIDRETKHCAREAA